MSAPRSAAERRLVARVQGGKAELTERIVTRARAEMPAYAALSAATIARDTGSIVDLLLAAMHDGHSLAAGEVETLREFGETRARQGILLSEIQNGWRIAVREIMGELTAAATARRVTGRALVELITALLDLVDQATIAYTGGHRDVELALARDDEQFRAEFTRAALLGTSGLAELRIRAQRLGLDPDLEYRAFRASESIGAQGISRSLGTSPRYFATLEGDTAGFVEKSSTLDIPPLIAFGPPVPLGSLDHSFRLAGRALTTARMFRLTGRVDLERLGLLPAVAADTELGEELARRFLDSLGAADSARTLIDTVEHFLDTGMRVETTAERLIVHPNTIRYRLARFEELAGTDLRSAHTAFQVWWAIKHRAAVPVSQA